MIGCATRCGNLMHVEYSGANVALFSSPQKERSNMRQEIDPIVARREAETAMIALSKQQTLNDINEAMAEAREFNDRKVIECVHWMKILVKAGCTPTIAAQTWQKTSYPEVAVR